MVIFHQRHRFIIKITSLLIDIGIKQVVSVNKEGYDCSVMIAQSFNNSSHFKVDKLLDRELSSLVL